MDACFASSIGCAVPARGGSLGTVLDVMREIQDRDKIPPANRIGIDKGMEPVYLMVLLHVIEIVYRDGTITCPLWEGREDYSRSEKCCVRHYCAQAISLLRNSSLFTDHTETDTRNKKVA